jgi:CubicO group peptidase (beta-lactamase class C family)
MALSHDRLSKVLRDHVATEFDAIGRTATASAIAASVSHDDEIWEDAAGVAQFDPERGFGIDSPLDLASVTKIFTATLIMQAAGEGRIELGDPIAPWIPGWDDRDSGVVTFLHLLNHSSGLPAWDQFYLRFPIVPDVATARATRKAIEAEIIEKPREPVGQQAVYSDLGYLLLGWLAERVWDEHLEELVESRIARPLGLDSIRYVSLRRDDEPISNAAATEIDPRRGGTVVGFVHDENCYIIGGVAGHAGLFGTARDVRRFGEHMLAVDRGEPGIVDRDVLQFCWSARARATGGHHVGGWDTPSGESSSAGRGFDPDATVGHLGFTGTSLWVERERGVVAALLTNRVYPTRENELIKPLRIAFHETVLPP